MSARLFIFPGICLAHICTLNRIHMVASFPTRAIVSAFLDVELLMFNVPKPDYQCEL